MSYTLVKKIIECDTEDLTSGQKTVLCCIANYCNSNNISYPSYATISRNSRLTKRTVIKWINKLEEYNYLSKRNRIVSQSGINYTNVYKINEDLINRLLSNQRTEKQNLEDLFEENCSNNEQNSYENVPSKISDDLEDFKKYYPNHDDIDNCEEYLSSAMKFCCLESILNAVMHYRHEDWLNKPINRIPKASVWLKNHMWEKYRPSRKPEADLSGKSEENSRLYEDFKLKVKELSEKFNPDNINPDEGKPKRSIEEIETGIDELLKRAELV